MAARTHLIAELSAPAALARLRDHCTNGAALWIVPTDFAVRAIGPLLPANARAVTLQHLAEEIVRETPLSAAQQRLLLEEVVTEPKTRDALPYFKAILETRAFPELALGTIAELKDHLVSPQQFAGLAKDAGTRQCAAIYRAYQDLLDKTGLADATDVVQRAAEMFQQVDGAERVAPIHTVCVQGFASFTAVQLALLTAYAQHIEELWIVLPDRPGDDREDLFRVPRETRKQLANFRLAEASAGQCSPSEPAGLAHLHRQLFRPRKAVERSANPDGLLFLEAPGDVGEARLVAREIRLLLDAGTDADSILVAVRELPRTVDLIRETFEEYGIPLEMEAEAPLSRSPTIAALLRASRLPEDDWPFAGTTALLRSSYFRPAWPEVEADPDVAQHAEALLRLIAAPRGREAALHLIRRWADKVQPGLEDEQALETRRQRIHLLAKRCLPFLERFFKAWDDVPQRGFPVELTQWLATFAERMGILGAAKDDLTDGMALAALQAELERWASLQNARPKKGPLTQTAFHRLLASLTATAPLPSAPRNGPRVRLLFAETARGLPVDFLFLMGLGEGAFPSLAQPPSLLDDNERQKLGLGKTAADRLSEEMLLFFQLVVSPRLRLTLSYAALDEKGHALLPCTFLTAVRDCFTDESLEPRSSHVKRRQMLTDGLKADDPLSAAEKRVRAARDWDKESRPVAADWGLPADLVANLQAGREMVQERMESDHFSPFDGLLGDACAKSLKIEFGPKKIISPTALENYIACPFKFFLRNVLKLSALEEPVEEIETTDRGQTFHRALARLHERRRKAGKHQPADDVAADLAGELDIAFQEIADRSSPAAEVLWKLEGQRLKRLARHYGIHWQKFVEPWDQKKAIPRPEYLEVAFGLPVSEGETKHDELVVSFGDAEVRISGRIDRIDVAELPGGKGLGFWVIDYKTGRAANYVAADLQQFRKLQLTLYALAAQQVLPTLRGARPMGLAYWLVVEKGVKLVLPGFRQPTAWLTDAAPWQKMRDALSQWVVELVTRIRQGEFPLKPRSEDCTATCDFGEVCRISQARPVVEEKSWRLPLPTMD
jgi:ATP-dependent helicase/DNAse subunit B